MARSVAIVDSESVVAQYIATLNREGRSAPALERLSSSESLTRKLKEYGDAYPDFRVHPLDMFSEGDLVVVRFILDLEARRPSWEVGADLPPELLEAIAVCRVENGSIVDLWLEMDIFAQVIGAGEGTRSGPTRVMGAHDHHAQTEASRSLVLRYLAALNNQRKSPELIERFAADPALTEHVMAFEAGFPDYNLLADEVIADGDRVAVRFHTRQRHAHAFMGIPATDRELSITGIIIYRVADGKIAEHWLQADTWALMLALQAGSPVLTKQQFIERRTRGDRRQPAGSE